MAIDENARLSKLEGMQPLFMKLRLSKETVVICSMLFLVLSLTRGEAHLSDSSLVQRLLLQSPGFIFYPLACFMHLAQEIYRQLGGLGTVVMATLGIWALIFFFIVKALKLHRRKYSLLPSYVHIPFLCSVVLTATIVTWLFSWFLALKNDDPIFNSVCSEMFYMPFDFPTNNSANEYRHRNHLNLHFFWWVWLALCFCYLIKTIMDPVQRPGKLELHEGNALRPN